MYIAHDPISGPGFFAVKHTEIESGQTVEHPGLISNHSVYATAVDPPVLNNHKVYASISFFTS